MVDYTYQCTCTIAYVKCKPFSVAYHCQNIGAPYYTDFEDLDTYSWLEGKRKVTPKMTSGVMINQLKLGKSTLGPNIRCLYPVSVT